MASWNLELAYPFELIHRYDMSYDDDDDDDDGDDTPRCFYD